ncbi:MAG TPA: transcriptional activator NhaR [Vicinamibacterales bacterium]|nr:transcriptional activator NhaR [Vicinamibacterales bacterium]
MSSLAWLNYHHLLYFWTVVREGGVAKAALKLRLSQPTISAQVHQLEDALDAPLLRREGRGLVLTDTGRVVFRYADEIFGLGREMVETLRGRPPGRQAELTVGVANAVPKLIAYRLLRPATQGTSRMALVCREGSTDQLLTELASHNLDVLITDTPVAPHVRVKVFNHLLGESDTTFFGTEAQAEKLRRGFPRTLDGQPLLVPTRNTALRRGLDDWFEQAGIRPIVAGEFEDSALLKVFGQGDGVVFPAPAAISRDICRVYGVRVIGTTSHVREKYYAVSAERRVKHPGVLAITSAGRDELFTTEARTGAGRRRSGVAGR